MVTAIIHICSCFNPLPSKNVNKLFTINKYKTSTLEEKAWVFTHLALTTSRVYKHGKRAQTESVEILIHLEDCSSWWQLARAPYCQEAWNETEGPLSKPYYCTYTSGLSRLFWAPGNLCTLMMFRKLFWTRWTDFDVLMFKGNNWF